MIPSRRILTGWVLLATAFLYGCAPSPARSAPLLSGSSSIDAVPTDQDQVEADAASFRAAFSEHGVAWVVDGRACVARAPAFQPVCPRLPIVVDVAWNGLDAWAAVPSLAQVVTLDRSARNVNVGRVVRLSSRAAYREDGSAVSFAGAALPGITGTPSAAVTAPDGRDYVRVGGVLRRLPDLMACPGSGPFLVGGPSTAWASWSPEVRAESGIYRLTLPSSATASVEWVDVTGQVRRRVPHGPGRIGLVGNLIVTVSPTGAVRRFNLQLFELS